MPTPQQQVAENTKACFDKAKELYGLDLSRVHIRFDLKGRAAGQACRRGSQYAIRYNHDMLTREAFDHVLNNTVPHEVAHIVCFMDPRLGSDHNSGWERVCKALGGTGATRHKEEVVYGKGCTYEYTTDRGNKVRVGDKYHKDIQAGRPLRYRNGIGTVTKQCAYSIVGVQGRTLAAPVVKVATATVAPVQAIVPAAVVPVVRPVAPAPRTYPVPAFGAAVSKAARSRAIMMAGHAINEPYENIIAAMMQACGYDRQLARATYKANYLKVGCPAA